MDKPDDIAAALQSALDEVLRGMEGLMSGAEELAEELSIMTEHYVQLAGCGDCGNWDPEGEDKVISARKKLAEFAEAKKLFDSEIRNLKHEG